HDEDLSSVEFAPGSDELAGAEGEKLARLAKALIDRPALRVSVTGLVDPASDKEGLLEQQLDDLLRQQLRVAGKAVGDDDPLTAADRTAGMRALWLERMVSPKEQEAARLRAEGKQPPPGLVPPREPPADARAQIIATLSRDP